MKNKIFYALLVCSLLFFNQQTKAQTATEDTTIVQTFTYQSPQNAWFVFPSDTNHYRKILMQYKLHCPDPTQCGEWDYLTYTYLYDHTGVMDSTLLNHSSFTVDDASPDSVSFMTSPSYSYQNTLQFSAVLDSATSPNTVTVGTGNQNSVFPLHSANPRTRAVYLYKASELLTAGLIAGNINSFSFNIISQGSELRHLKIRFAAATLDSLTDPNLTASWQEVYHQNTLFASAGLNNLLFTQPFIWNGTSDILMEVSYDNDVAGTDNVIAVTPQTYSTGIVSSGNDRSIYYNASEFVQVPTNGFAAIDSFITVSYWAYGDVNAQPNNGTCFEGVGANGHRVVNAHCPWSDLNVYWDAGSDGSNVDRIQKLATTNETEGKWNYWTFTKNIATGSQKIYLNGNLWHSGSALTRPMNGIDYFRIGKGNWSGSESYRGNIDEFAVWNVELDQATIQQYMYKDIDALHPFYSNLACYYSFNNHNNVSFTDGSSGNHDATIMGSLDNNFVPAQTLFRNYTKIYERPNVIFEQGNYFIHMDTSVTVDTIENAAYTIVLFGDTLNPTTATDTITVWSNYSYSNNAYTNAIDTTLLSPDNTLHKQTWYYYSAPFEIVNQYELSRFITLYGNGTSLGANGRTWVYDLTNLAPLLHDSVQLSSGNWQEWLDMKFIMIKGKPARDPISVVNLWNGDIWHPSAATQLMPKRIKIDPLAQNTMWRSITTGHGQYQNSFQQPCDEFCPFSQYGLVNGVQKFQQLIWRDDCGHNPLYPQGGTWIYQRANWCPGAEVREYNWELTPYVTPGDSVTLDLNLDPSTIGGNYVISTQLISFKLPNFSLDAEMYDILSPNDRDEWSRINPICSEPVVRIRNGGTTPLTSAIITYGLDGGGTYTYNWTGNLGFLQTADVTLSSMWWSGNGSNRFYATISNPNGGTDMNEHNNTEHTHFNAPAVYDLSSSATQKFVVEVKTNLNGSETSYQLRSTGGVVLLDRNNLSPNTFYRDTINFNEYECYTFEIFDVGEDGLSFWANPSQGSGYARIKRADYPLILKSFPADFGAEYIHNFKINWPLGVVETPSAESSMDIAPNPAIDAIDVTVALKDGTDKVEATLMDLSGRALKKQTQPFAQATEFNFDVTDLAQGLYFVKVKSGNKEFVQKFIKVND